MAENIRGADSTKNEDVDNVRIMGETAEKAKVYRGPIKIVGLPLLSC